MTTRSRAHQNDHGRGAVAPSRLALHGWYVEHLRAFNAYIATSTPLLTIDDLQRRHDSRHADDGELEAG